MEKKRFKFVIPVMVIVAIGSVYMLRNYHAEVLIKTSSFLIY